MRLLQLTDLHLEWNTNLKDYSLFINEKVADVVILTGDIHANVKGISFIQHLIDLGYQVIYVLGNHEFYNRTIDGLIAEWRELASKTPGLHFLEGDSVTIEDVTFFGSCLWTQMGTSSKDEEVDFFLKHRIKREDDFTCIANWNPQAMANRFYEVWEVLQKQITDCKNPKKVMLSHYLPSWQSIHPSYFGNPSNAFFASHLDDFILKSGLTYWFHGHTHTDADYFIGDQKNGCRVICKPYGYHDLSMVNPEFNWMKNIYDI